MAAGTNRIDAIILLQDGKTAQQKSLLTRTKIQQKPFIFICSGTE